VVGYKHLVRPTIREVVTLCTAQCKMLYFCVKTIDRFKLASLKKKKMEEEEGLFSCLPTLCMVWYFCDALFYP